MEFCKLVVGRNLEVYLNEPMNIYSFFFENEDFAETISWAEKMLIEEQRNTAHDTDLTKEKIKRSSFNDL